MRNAERYVLSSGTFRRVLITHDVRHARLGPAPLGADDAHSLLRETAIAQVFTASAAIVRGTALLAPFHYPQRQCEEPVFAAAFRILQSHAQIDAIAVIEASFKKKPRRRGAARGLVFTRTGSFNATSGNTISPSRPTDAAKWRGGDLS